jgi:hypothetical protein
MDAHTPRNELGHCKAGIVWALNGSDLAIRDVSLLREAHRGHRTVDS